MTVKVSVTVNGAVVAAEIADRTLLVHFLRDVAGLTSVSGRGAAYGLPGIEVDGNDVLAVKEAARWAAKRAIFIGYLGRFAREDGANG